MQSCLTPYGPVSLLQGWERWPSKSSWPSCKNFSIIVYCIGVQAAGVFTLIVKKRGSYCQVYAWTGGIDCIEGSRAWCGSLVPSLLPQRNLTSFDLLLLLRANPLPTRASYAFFCLCSYILSNNYILPEQNSEVNGQVTWWHEVKIDHNIRPNLKATKIGTRLVKNRTSMGFSVKKRDMHKLALFSLQKWQKIRSKKRGQAKKSGTAVFLTSKIGIVPPK